MALEYFGLWIAIELALKLERPLALVGTSLGICPDRICCGFAWSGWLAARNLGRFLEK
jgi:hypothetical protein